ncbi:hypothetical protein BLOT_000266 [Blomia tropicalis]|nr:hypothetical protein BLOT_000266 [Blomia tropicalis]
MGRSAFVSNHSQAFFSSSNGSLALAILPRSHWRRCFPFNLINLPDVNAAFDIVLDADKVCSVICPDQTGISYAVPKKCQCFHEDGFR